MTERIETQIERFAPGFRELILARATAAPAAVDAHNPNYVGGDIAAGANTIRQTIFRPTPALRSYRTPVPGLYLCSAATPPGGAVHGMRAALTALGDLNGAPAGRSAPWARLESTRWSHPRAVAAAAARSASS